MPTTTKSSKSPKSPKPKGRRPRAEPGEQTSIKVPPSLKGEAKSAMMMVSFLTPDDAPSDFTAYVLRALRQQIARDRADFTAAGGVLPKK